MSLDETVVLAVSHLPCCIAWAVLERDGLVLPGRLGLRELQMLLDRALGLSVVHEPTVGNSARLPAVRVLCEKFAFQGLHVGALGCLHED